MNFKLVLLIGFIWFEVTVLFSQTHIPHESNEEEHLQQLIELYAETHEQASDFQSLFDHLHYYTSNPISINQASFDEFNALGLLSRHQIEEILKYRKVLHGFVDVQELKSLQIFTTIEFNILPYVLTVKGKNNAKKSLKEEFNSGNHLWLINSKRVLETKEGYKNNSYEGDPWKILSKYKYNLGMKFSAGVTVEKDPGEAIFQQSNSSFDYYNAHVLLRQKNIFNTVVIGHYELNIGQGLHLWNGFSPKKSSAVFQIEKSGLEIKPYTSVNENNALQGMAVKLKLKKCYFSLFYAHQSIDGNLGNDSINYISSIQTSGLHRTTNEIEDEKSVTKKVIGSRLLFYHSKGHIGFCSSYTHLDKPLFKTPKLYNYHSFRGNQITNISMDYRLRFAHSYLFGETAYSWLRGLATLNGLMLHENNNMHLMLVHRYTGLHYFSFMKNSLSNTSSSAESGMYLAIRYHPLTNLAISAYYDIYKYRWLKFGTDAPSKGRDMFVQATYGEDSKTSILFRLQRKHQEENKRTENGERNVLIDAFKTKIRVELRHQPHWLIKTRSRIEWSFFNKESGVMVFQDVQWRLRRLPFKFYSRFSLFHTSSHQTGISSYETDVKYSISIPTFSNAGYRYYMMMRIKFSSKLKLWIKYSRTTYLHVSTLSQGNELNPNPYQSEINCQLLLQL